MKPSSRMLPILLVLIGAAAPGCQGSAAPAAPSAARSELRTSCGTWECGTFYDAYDDTYVDCGICNSPEVCGGSGIMGHCGVPLPELTADQTIDYVNEFHPGVPVSSTEWNYAYQASISVDSYSNPCPGACGRNCSQCTVDSDGTTVCETSSLCQSHDACYAAHNGNLFGDRECDAECLGGWGVSACLAGLAGQGSDIACYREGVQVSCAYLN